MIVKIVHYDFLTKTKTLDVDVNLETVINTNSKYSSFCYADSHIRSLKVGQFIHYNKKGYYRIDEVSQDVKDIKYTLIHIPDGKIS